jgi:hypothetical protein
LVKHNPSIRNCNGLQTCRRIAGSENARSPGGLVSGLRAEEKRAFSRDQEFPDDQTLQHCVLTRNLSTLTGDVYLRGFVLSSNTTDHPTTSTALPGLMDRFLGGGRIQEARVFAPSADWHMQDCCIRSRQSQAEQRRVWAWDPTRVPVEAM